MTTLTITVDGNKTGEVIYFRLSIAKSNFLKVVDTVFNSVQDVLDGESSGEYTIIK